MGRDNTSGDHEVARIRRQIAAVVFGILAIFLFSSEFMNAMFNNRLDEEGADLATRFVFSFKPTVIAIYLVFSAILYLVILRYLRPLFGYVRTGKDYDAARTAAVNVPWVIVAFQLAAWTFGTTAYYIMRKWQAESGIPFGLGLPLKIAVGLPAGVYTAVLFNIILIPLKERLRIHALTTAENDTFSRNRDSYVVLSIIVFIVVNFIYITYYYTNTSSPITFASFYLPLLIAAVFYSGVSFGLMALSKHEYKTQVATISSVLRQLSEGKADLGTRIDIINYNELGEIAGFSNRILDNFADILDRITSSTNTISESVQQLSLAGRQDAAYANQQASATTEIVRTMEEVDRLAKEIGDQARTVAQVAGDMDTKIQQGFDATNDTIRKMGIVKQSNAGTIDEMGNLNRYITDIWDVVKIINGIAGQIKIIAFNATLEAASAGEAGKNFEIVASEIRRLADNTVASTSEIRTRIETIQKASNALIAASVEDTEHIREAWELAHRQEATFQALRSLSLSSSDASKTMRDRVSHQIQAYEQVLVTLKQTSAAIGEFSESIEGTNRTAEQLQTIVESLGDIVDHKSASSDTRPGEPT